MLYQYCLPFAVIACSVLGKIVQVSHSSEEVLALKKEIARCQVEADKLRTAISLNKVCSGIYAANALPQSLMDNPVPAPPPPPPPPAFHALWDSWSVVWQGFAPSLVSHQTPPHQFSVQVTQWSLRFLKDLQGVTV